MSAPPPRRMQERATRNQTFKKLLLPSTLPALRHSSAPAAFVSGFPRFSARPVFQRVGHFIQVFVFVNNFLQISLPVAISTNTVFSAPCFSGRDILFRSSPPSTTFANFFARCDFDEHRLGRPPRLRGGVSIGFRFWVNRVFQKVSPPHRRRCPFVRRSEASGFGGFTSEN